MENGKLILPIQKNDVETTGSVGTVTVVIKSTNYADITLTVAKGDTVTIVVGETPKLRKRRNGVRRSSARTGTVFGSGSEDWRKTPASI